jgi:prepilin-type N-terminal cleavage/methylation domain-containing protein
MKRFAIRKNTGVTLTELLVVLAIIGLLATIAVPVYVNRAEQAKVKIAWEETRAIGQAEEAIAVVHGFYVPLQLLDDIPETSDSANDDSINNEPGSIYLIDAGVNAGIQQGSQWQLTNTDENRQVANLVYFWQGPFLNPTRVYYDPDTYDNPWDPTMSTSDRRRDYPLDPWGQPYRMYSEVGIVGSGALNDDNYNSDSFSNGSLTSSDDRFDRYAIVSWGPDAMRDSDPSRSPTKTDDDIVHYFGAVIAETTYAAY